MDEWICRENIKLFKFKLNDARGVRRTILLRLLELEEAKLRALLAYAAVRTIVDRRNIRGCRGLR